MVMVVYLVLDSHSSTFYEQLYEREKYGLLSPKVEGKVATTTAR